MILTIAHTKGGVGKSTLAWNTIFVLQERLNKSVKVVDLDFQQTTYFLNMIRQSENKKGVEVLQPKSVSELLNICESYTEDVLLIDVGGYDNDLTRNAIKVADKILTPISNSPTEYIGFKVFQSVLAQCKNPHIHVVFNVMHRRRKNFKSFESILDEYPNKTFTKTVVRSSKSSFVNPLATGNTVLDTKNIQDIKDIEDLCHELI